MKRAPKRTAPVAILWPKHRRCGDTYRGGLRSCSIHFIFLKTGSTYKNAPLAASQLANSGASATLSKHDSESLAVDLEYQPLLVVRGV